MRISGVAVPLVLFACSPPMSPPDGQPPPAPTGQTGAVEADGTVSLRWANTSRSDFARSLVARFGPGGSAQKPDGTPAVGDPIGKGGMVLYLGTDSAFVDRQPPVTCGSVSYRVWSQDTKGRWSDDFASVSIPAGATTPPPTQSVSMMSVSAQSGFLTVSWVNPPTSSGWFQTSLVRKVDSAPTALTDGMFIATTAGTSYGESLSNYAPGTQLFYAAFACNTCGKCLTTGSTVSFAVPGPDGGVDAGIDAGTHFDSGIGADGGLSPRNFAVALSPDGQEVRLSWVNSASPDLTRVRVTRSLTERPDGGSSTTFQAVPIFEGLTTQTSERVDLLLPSLNPARTYTYQAQGCGAAGCEPGGPTFELSLTLKQALRGGGYTLFWRHASASICGDATQLCPATSGQTCAQALAGTSSAGWWRTCAADPPTCSTTARQLDPVPSSNETSAVRTWFQSNGVTVSRILASEYCRGFATAQQFMFGPTVEQNSDLTYYVYEENLRCAKSMALLNLTPSPGTNIGMVSHAGFFCPTLDSLQWGEAAILKPQPPSNRTCSTVGSCAATQGELQAACVAGRCVTPLLIARVPALGGGSWSTLP